MAAFFIAQFAVAVAVGGVLAAIGKSSEIDTFLGSDSYWPKVVIYFFIYALMVVIIFQLMRFWRWIEKRSDSGAAGAIVEKKKQKKTSGSYVRESIRFFKLDTLPSAKQFLEVILYFVMYMITMLFVGGLLQLVKVINVDQKQDLGVSPPIGVSSVVAVAIIFVVLPPICEEILFRGYLYNKLRQFAPLGLSVLLTSVLFGIAHLEYGNLNWVAAVDTFVFSLYLIFVSQKHQSLYSAIMLHALKNGLAMTLFVTGIQATSLLK